MARSEVDEEGGKEKAEEGEEGVGNVRNDDQEDDELEQKGRGRGGTRLVY